MKLDIQSAEYMITPPPGMGSLRQFAGWDVVQSDGVTSDQESTGSESCASSQLGLRYCNYSISGLYYFTGKPCYFE